MRDVAIVIAVGVAFFFMTLRVFTLGYREGFKRALFLARNSKLDV